MGNEQFKGFEPPKTNYSKLPHALIEALPNFSSLAELKVVLYILRHTWGFQEFDDLKRITLDEFQYGRRLKNRSRMDDGTGMSKEAIREGLKRATKDGFIIQSPDPRPRPGLPAHCYQLKVLEVSPLETSIGKKLAIEVLEVSPSSEKDTIERKRKPDLFDLAQKTVDAREEAGGNYAVPPSAGGIDSFAEGPLDAFATFIAGVAPALLPLKTRKSWAAKLRQIAEHWSTEERPITADIMERAIKAIPDSDIGWKTYKSPHSTRFAEDIVSLLLGDGKPTEHILKVGY